jgi:hypothetical protein
MLAGTFWGGIGVALALWGMMYTPDLQAYRQLLLWGAVASLFISVVAFFIWVRGRSKARGDSTRGDASPIQKTNQGNNTYQVYQGPVSVYQGVSAAATTVPKGAAEIDLIFGYDGHYIETNSFNSVNIMKTMCVGVKNTGGVYLSNCKLMFEARRPKDGVSETWLRHGPFSLNVGEERYLSVAAYNEPISPQTTPENWIRLSFESNNFWSAPMLPASGGSVTLTATSAESRECRTICKFWVKERKLFWEAAPGSLPAIAASNVSQNEDEKFIPMPEAAARAYGELRVAKSSWSKAADTFAQQGVPERIFFSSALAGEVPLYGKHPPSPLYEAINSDEFKSGSFEDEGATFRRHGERKPRYVDVAVKSGDLSKAIDLMRDKMKNVSW